MRAALMEVLDSLENLPPSETHPLHQEPLLCHQNLHFPFLAPSLRSFFPCCPADCSYPNCNEPGAAPLGPGQPAVPCSPGQNKKDRKARDISDLVLETLNTNFLFIFKST